MGIGKVSKVCYLETAKDVLDFCLYDILSDREISIPCENGSVKVKLATDLTDRSLAAALECLSDDDFTRIFLRAVVIKNNQKELVEHMSKPGVLNRMKERLKTTMGS